MRMTPEQTALVEKNVALAKFLAVEFLKKSPENRDLDELISHAYQGLVDAARRYRQYGEEHNYSEESISSGQFFSVFARKRILGAMLNSQRKEDHVHPYVRRDYKAITKAGFVPRSNNSIPMETLATSTGLTVERIQKVIRMVEIIVVSTDEMEEEARDQLVSSHEVEGSALEARVRESFVQVFDTLPEPQQVVVAMRVFSGLDFKEISSELDITVNKASSLHSDAVLKIREVMFSHVADDEENVGL